MKDELEEQTEPYKPEESDTEPSDIEEDELDELSTQLRTMFCHENLSEISVEPAMLDSNNNETQEQISSFNLELIRDKGLHRCGYQGLPNEINVDTTNNEFISNQNLQNENSASDEQNRTDNIVPDDITAETLYSVMISSKTRVITIPGDPDNDEQTTSENNRQSEANEVVNANGTAESVLEYAKMKKLDREQKQAFALIIANFILTFIHQIEESCPRETSTSTNTVSIYSLLRRQTKMLHKLGGELIVYVCSLMAQVAVESQRSSKKSSCMHVNFVHILAFPLQEKSL